jgi:hypothetical protein
LLPVTKLSNPSFRSKKENESVGPPSMDEGKMYFFTTLICGAYLFLTGLALKML